MDFVYVNLLKVTNDLLITIVVLSVISFLMSVFIFLAIFIPLLIKHRNYYPSITIEVDITNKKIGTVDDAIDYYIFTYGIDKIMAHTKAIEVWKHQILDKCKKSPDKIKKIIDRWSKNSHKAFVFHFYRIKTRYRQINYVRHPYKVKETIFYFNVRETTLNTRIDFLKKHNYYVTLDQYNRIDQRKALTKKLREYIKQRDNYTCQICGKYMPDEVGLHIDHIIPVSKGGKSVPDNLRVLCSKCNGRKSNN